MNKAAQKAACLLLWDVNFFRLKAPNGSQEIGPREYRDAAFQ